MSAALNTFYIKTPPRITVFKTIVIMCYVPYNYFADRERLCIGGFLWKKTPVLRLPKRRITGLDSFDMPFFRIKKEGTANERCTLWSYWSESN